MADIVIIGGGHAGIEAAAAAARMGMECVLVTLDGRRIGAMSCNPSIGGLAKGQIVREIDALGGVMAGAADACGIQFRMLNTGKGPAVRALRAQEDSALYCAYMRRLVLRQERLTLVQGCATDVLAAAGRVRGVRLRDGSEIPARAVIVTAGTFLRGLMHTGPDRTPGGRAGEEPASELSESLGRLGLERGRLKTGTPARLDGRTIDFTRLDAQHGDEPPRPFSHATARLARRQVPCHITYTNERTHDVIRRNLGRSPLYGGAITGIGPRYCPSIEDKVVKFPGRDRHQIYLEPEGRRTHRVYPNGISTSLPRDVQEEIVASIEGLERAKIEQWGYAIEYDFFPPIQIRPTFETKAVEGLYLAGQVCGTSGYEEAAGQGLLAGINAVLKLRGAEPCILGRDEAYLGVLADDLCVLSPAEPYRMFTSSAEFRLLLRHDNADLRLLRRGAALGLQPREAEERVEAKRRAVADALDALANTRREGKNLLSVLRRPEVGLRSLCGDVPALAALAPDVFEEVEIEGKYAGYIERQRRDVERLARGERKRLPPDFDYASVAGMRREAREKLARVKPYSVGQARRIAGVRPADVAVLLVALKAGGRGAEEEE
ncbi:MAG TPA: tRNA uridine-5-carboxymethylaminomethyl(34) synthesis enzyme MnmG [Planctomycetes bacterium]|nr:tRNA uridine-5-carboxymethylaminomethyl(34) synthesis enzyme MnmG [Planctomycetota bacterium]